MAKGKGGKSSGNVSQGIHSNVSKTIRKEMRRDYLNSQMRVLNQQKALRQGKDIVATIENPNKAETNKPFIRQRISGKSYIDYMKNKTYVMKEVQ